MKIILSPTKKMRRDVDTVSVQGLPVYLDRTRKILRFLHSLSPEQLQKLWGCNEKIAAQNVQRLQEMDLENDLSPAILSYEGIAFQYMAPGVFEDSAFDYVQQHLRILSGFYGILKPLDGITPYRLEMQAQLPVEDCSNLYEFWGDSLYREVQGGTIINLASKEYSQCISPYLGPEDRMITCVFGEMVNGKLRQKGTFAKMARGEMVRFLAQTQAEVPEKMQEFTGLNFHFRQDLSCDSEYVFQRIPK